jgi:alcohol dehydrogenase class IV
MLYYLAMVLLPNFNSGSNSGRHITKTKLYWGVELNHFLQQTLILKQPTIYFIDQNLSLIDSYDLYDGKNIIKVESEPSRKLLEEIVSQYGKTPLNIVAIGGGSTIDLAKAFICSRKFSSTQRIGYGPMKSKNDDFSSRDDILVAIPTTLGSGSESSRYFVLFEEDGRKMPSRSWQAIPDFVLLSPPLLRYLDSDTAVYQLFDAYIHSLEVMSSVYEGFIPTVATSQVIAIQLRNWLTSSDFCPELDDATILELQLMSSMAGQCISNTRTGLLHTFGEILSEFLEISHVTSLASCGVHLKELVGGKTRFIDTKILSSLRKSIRCEWEFVNAYSERVLSIDKTTILIKANFPSTDILMERLLTDTVLWEKEFPFKVQEQDIYRYVDLTRKLIMKRVD